MTTTTTQTTTSTIDNVPVGTKLLAILANTRCGGGPKVQLQREQPMQFAERLALLTAAQRSHFHEVLAHNLLVVVRRVRLDASLSDAEKAERSKWLQGILQCAAAQVHIPRRKVDARTEWEFGSQLVDFTNCPEGIWAEVLAAVNCGYRAVAGEDMA